MTKYIAKFLHPEGRHMYFASWGAGLTMDFKRARRFNNDFQAIDVCDKFLESRDLGLFHVEQKEGEKA